MRFVLQADKIPVAPCYTASTLEMKKPQGERSWEIISRCTIEIRDAASYLIIRGREFHPDCTVARGRHAVLALKSPGVKGDVWSAGTPVRYRSSLPPQSVGILHRTPFIRKWSFYLLDRSPFIRKLLFNLLDRTPFIRKRFPFFVLDRTLFVRNISFHIDQTFVFQKFHLDQTKCTPNYLF